MRRWRKHPRLETVRRARSRPPAEAHSRASSRLFFSAASPTVVGSGGGGGGGGGVGAESRTAVQRSVGDGGRTTTATDYNVLFSRGSRGWR